MIGAKVTCRVHMDRVALSEKRSRRHNIRRAAAYIYRVMRNSIKTHKSSSPVGTPPHTRLAKRLKNAIVFVCTDMDDNAVIGPRYSVAGPSGGVHEYGEEYYGRQYPERPFAGPALDASLPHISDFWEDSIS